MIKYTTLKKTLRNFAVRSKKLEARVKLLESQYQLTQPQINNEFQSKETEQINNENPPEEKIIPEHNELRFDSKYIGYMTICSSVQTYGRTKLISNSDQNAKKSALGGPTLDITRLENYLIKETALAHRQAKYEYSAESVSAASKEEFLKSLVYFYDNIRNDSCMLFFSGHGLQDTSLVFETAIENYHVKYEDVIPLWKTRANKKNKHFFVILDCCYSGSWVVQLFENGDYIDVSVQASSSYDEKSNDLGQEIGSLFTTMIVRENGLKVTDFNMKDPNVKSGFDTQTPMAFCGKWGMSHKLFGKVGFNSWEELLGPIGCSAKVIKSPPGAVSIINEVTSENAPKIEFLAILIEKDRLIMQGDLILDESLKKKACIMSTVNKEFSSNMLGNISIWTKLNEKNAKGIFFRDYKSKIYAFEISEDLVRNTLNLIKKWISDQDSDPNLALILESLNLLTEINKNNLIHNNDEDDADAIEEENIDFDLLRSESLSPLENLSISGQLLPETVKSLVRSIGNGTLRLKSLKIPSISCNIREANIIYDINCISVKIDSNTHGSVFNFVMKAVPFFSKHIEILFSEKPEEYSIRFPLLFSNFSMTTNLRSLAITNISRDYFNSIKESISVSMTLELISLINCDFTESDKLLKLIFEKTHITSVSLVNAKLSMNLEPHRHITYLNLSKNKLTSKNIKLLMQVKFTSKYTIDLSHNMINSSILPELSVFLRDNVLCNQFNLSGNYLTENSIISLARYNLLYKCTVVTFDFSDTNLSSIDTKSLSNLLCKAKNLKNINFRNCKLGKPQLLDVMEVVKEGYSTSIASIDISYNKILDEDLFNTLRLRVKYSKSLQSLFMIGCVNLNTNKPIIIEGFLLCPNLSIINLSDWKATLGFNAGTKVSKSLSHITLKGFIFAESSKLHLENLEMDYLEIDSEVFRHTLLPHSCQNLILYEVDEELLSTSSTLISQAQSLHIDDPNSNLNSLMLNKLLIKSSVKESESLSFRLQDSCFELKSLIAEEVDECASNFLLEIIAQANSQIRSSLVKIKGENQDIKNQLQILNDVRSICSPHSNELQRILVARQFFELNGNSTIQRGSDENIDSAAKILVLSRNCFDIEKLLKTKFSQLEVLELHALFLKSNMLVIEEFITNNPTIKVLLIRYSEINYLEIKSICRIVSSLKTSIEELHLVNTFIDSKEAKPLLSILLESAQFTTLNLSSNSISIKLIIEFSLHHPGLHSLILRDCSLTKDDVYEALSILKKKPMQTLDLSGLRFDPNAIKLKTSQSKWCTDDNTEDYMLIVNYSSRMFMSHCTNQLQILHLNRINFDQNSCLVSSIMKSNQCIPIVAVSQCQNENSFMKNLYILTRQIKIQVLDLSRSLMKELNTKFLIDFIQNQVTHLENSRLHIDISHTNLEDYCFELLYDYASDNPNSMACKFDISYNMLTSISRNLYNILGADSKKMFENLRGAFCGELGSPSALDIIQNDNENRLLPKHKEMSTQRATVLDNKLIFTGHDNKVKALIKLDDDLVASGSWDSTIKVWQISTSTCLYTLTGHRKTVNVLIKMNDNIIVSGSDDKTIKVWDISTFSCLHTLFNNNGLVKALIKITDDLIVSGSSDKAIKVWNLLNFECILILTGHSNTVNTLVKLNNNLIASGSWDCTIKIWQLSTSACLCTFTGHTNSVTTLVKMNDSHILSGSWDKTIKLWKINTSTCLFTFTGHLNPVNTLIKMSDDLVMSGSDDKTIKIWQLSTSSCLKTFTGHKGYVKALVKMSDNLIISGSDSSYIMMKNIKKHIEVSDRVKLIYNSYMLELNTGFAHTLVKMNDNLVLSACSDNTIHLWELTNNNFTYMNSIRTSVSTLIRINEDLAVSGSIENTIKVWQLSTLTCLSTLYGHKNPISALLKINDDLIASGSDDNTVKLWQLSSSLCLKTFTGHTGLVKALAKINNDLIVSGSTDNSLKLWQLSTSTCIFTLKGHDGLIKTLLTMSDDLVVSGSDDRTIKVWQLSTSSCLETLKNHCDSVYTLMKISYDLFASGSSDRTIILWKLSTFTCLRVLSGHNAYISILIKINDDILLSASEDKTIKIWRLSATEVSGTNNEGVENLFQGEIE